VIPKGESLLEIQNLSFLIAKLTSNHILRLAIDKHEIIFVIQPVEKWTQCSI
jgi:hypothetical protein